MSYIVPDFAPGTLGHLIFNPPAGGLPNGKGLHMLKYTFDGHPVTLSLPIRLGIVGQQVAIALWDAAKNQNPVGEITIPTQFAFKMTKPDGTTETVPGRVAFSVTAMSNTKDLVNFMAAYAIPEDQIATIYQTNPTVAHIQSAFNNGMLHETFLPFPFTNGAFGADVPSAGGMPGWDRTGCPWCVDVLSDGGLPINGIRIDQILYTE